MERCMQERYEKSGSERGQHDKQVSMEEYGHQLYRRPQMTGQAREEEEEDSQVINVSQSIRLFTVMGLGKSMKAYNSVLITAAAIADNFTI